MAESPTLSTIALPPDLDAHDLLGLRDQLAARIAALEPPKGGKQAGDAPALPAGVSPMKALPPHIDRPWARFDAAAAELVEIRRQRASAMANEAHAASDETERDAANADADDRWRAFEQWNRGAAGLADDGKAPSPAEARWLHAQLFPAPEGLRFITRRPRAQWTAMEQRMNVLAGDRAQAVIKGFGGARHHAQLAAAHKRFGRAFGFTVVVVPVEEGPTDGRPQWTAARDALRTLVQKIEGHADPDLPGTEALSAFLLAPYIEMAADLEQSRKSRAKKAAPAGPQTP